MYNAGLPGPDGQKCQIARQNTPNSFRNMPNKPKQADGCRI